MLNIYKYLKYNYLNIYDTLTAKDPKQRDLKGSLGAYLGPYSSPATDLGADTFQNHCKYCRVCIPGFKIIVNTVAFASQASKSL